MAAQNLQFKQEFQTSIDTLNGLNQRIQDSLRQKEQFSTSLLEKLTDINSRIQALSGLIQQLQATVAGLQGQAGTNSTAITDKDRQIGELTQQKQALEDEKQQLIQEVTRLGQQSASSTADLQQQIDASEGQIRDLTARNTAIQQQADALTAELAARGDLQGQHAQAIAAQTQQAQDQLAQQAAANQQQIDQITAGIAVKDTQIADLQQQLQAKTAETEAHVQNITTTQGQTQTQITQLQTQIQALTTENDDLIQRIQAGTVAIQRATQNLEALIDAVPNARTQQDVDQLFAQINQSIQSISNSLQGNSSGGLSPPPPPAAAASSPLPSPPPPRIPALNVLIDQLNTKKSRRGPNQASYERAYNAIRKPNITQSEISAILQREGIQISPTSGNIMGGRKTKKYKKQKGGFTYRANTKRKSISTISLTRGRGLRKGRRSSKTSKHF